MPSANITAATVDTVPATDRSALRQRVISALVLAPIPLVAAFLGRPFWDILIAATAALMAWEWARLCGRGATSLVGLATIALAPLMVAIGAIWGMAVALIALLIAVVATAVAAAFEKSGGQSWLALGVAYVGVPCLALTSMRAMPDGGLATLLWVLALVWATDTAAYAAGRTIGGPKLAPKISPNKTWAGLLGGIVAAGLVGIVAAVWLSVPSVSLVVLLSAGLAIVEQAGDLFESWVKRHFGVKDSGNLIPGHGGVLDRVDGLLAVSFVVAGLSWGLQHTILLGP
jgi:phosphatidate cytidylyltransferase